MPKNRCEPTAYGAAGSKEGRTPTNKIPDTRSNGVPNLPINGQVLDDG